MRLEEYLITEISATQMTKLQESLHCVALGIIQLKGKVTVEMLNDPDLFAQSYNRYCDVDAGAEELWQFLESSDKWATSVVMAVNALQKSGYLKKRNYTFYRGKGLMNVIYDEFNRLSKNQGIKLANDKWNPGDIWASSHKGLPKAFDNLQEYNKFISDSLNKGEIVGISLKQVGKSAKVEWQGPPEKPIITKYDFVKKGNKSFPTGVNIWTTNGIVSFNVRSFNIRKAADIQAEIAVKGSSARHGKVAANVYAGFVRKYNIPQMTDDRIKQYINGGEPVLKELVRNLWSQTGIKLSDGDIDKGWENDQDGNLDNFLFLGYWKSIIHSLELAAFLEQNKSVADEIVTDFYISGKSISSNSSEFIKVS